MGISDYFKKRRENRMNKLFDRANQNLENNLNLFGRGAINEQKCFSTVSFFTAEIISYGIDLVGYERKLPVSRIAGTAMITSCYMIVRLDSKINSSHSDFVDVINERVFDEIREHNRVLDKRRIDNLYQSSNYKLREMLRKNHHKSSLIDYTCKELLGSYQNQRGFDISHKLDGITSYFKFAMDKYEISLEKRLDIISR